jgi:hypothetical protein
MVLANRGIESAGDVDESFLLMQWIESIALFIYRISWVALSLSLMSKMTRRQESGQSNQIMVSVARWSQALLKDCFKTGSRILCRTTSCTWSRVVVVVYSQQFRIALTPSIPEPEPASSKSYNCQSAHAKKLKELAGNTLGHHLLRTQALRQGIDGQPAILGRQM